MNMMRTGRISEFLQRLVTNKIKCNCVPNELQQMYLDAFSSSSKSQSGSKSSAIRDR
jgi:hypothetical protein